MNTIQNNGPEDNSLKDDLEKLGRDYQQLKSEEPPELLDQAVLNSAHLALERRAGWMDFGWIHGLTTAAVVVLALTIILTQRQPARIEESGMLPADPASLGRAQNSELKTIVPRRERVKTEPEHKEDFRKDMLQATPAVGELEEDTMQVNAPAAATVAKRAIATLADELSPAESRPVKVDAVKSDADKFEAERSQLPDEEAQLQAILMLKHAGNDKWKAELKLFIESYPDYPLPDELKN